MPGGFHTKRCAFSAADLLWVLFIILLLIAILLPSLMRARQLSGNAVCAANLKGIGTGCHIYANENEEWFPNSSPPFTEPRPRSNEHSIAFIGQISANLTEPDAKLPRDKRSVTRSLFLLIIGGYATPGQFICPATSEVPDNLRNLKAGQEVAAQPGVNRFDFKGYPNISYGYQLPFGPRAQGRIVLDPRMAISADKGPYFEAAATNSELGTTPDRLVPGAAPPVFASADAALTASPAEWQPFNSRNHRGEGQNVLFGDSHAEFARRPDCGVNRENIYTMATEYSSVLASLNGALPQDFKGPLLNTDSLIVP